MDSLARELLSSYLRRLTKIGAGVFILASVTIGTVYYGSVVVPRVLWSVLEADGPSLAGDQSEVVMLLVGIGGMIGLLLVFRPRIRLLLACELMVTVLVIMLGLHKVIDKLEPYLLASLWVVAIPVLPMYRQMKSGVRRYEMLISAPAPDLIEP